MKENLSNSKNNKAKLYKALSIAGVSTLSGAGLIGIAISVANIVTTKEKNLGTDYGQGLNFNLQFSLNDPTFKGDNIEGMVQKLQQTANSLSSKLYKLGLKQIKLVPRIEHNVNIKNNNLSSQDSNIYGVIDINVDSQEGTRWYLNPKIQELFQELNNASDAAQKQKIFDDYVNKNYPNEPELKAKEKVINELTDNSANKLAIYFATQSVGKVSLAGNLTQPILNNTNNIEFQNVDRGNKTGSNPSKKDESFQNPFTQDANQSHPTNLAYQSVDNNSKNTRLVETDVDSNKKINLEIDIPNLKINNWKPKGISSTNSANAILSTKEGYLNLSGFLSQFNSVFGWEKHNNENPDNEWETYQDAVDAKKSEDEQYESKLEDPQASWVLWTNRSGLITRLNYIGLLAYTSLQINQLSGLELKYWDNLVGDQNKSYNEFNGDNKKTINGKLIKQITDANNEETKYYYWIKEKLISQPTSLKNYLYDFEYSTQNQNQNLQTSSSDRLLNNLNDFYTSSIFSESSQPSTPDSGSSSDTTTTPTTYGVNSKNYDWLRSWSWNSHDLVSPYGCTIDYANFYKYFDIANLDDVFGKDELKQYNENAKKDGSLEINQYNSAFTKKIKYDTNQKTISDAQNVLDDYGTYNYGNDIINTEILDAGKEISTTSPSINANLQLFGNIIYDFATLSNRSLPNSVIGIDPWTSTFIGISVLVLIIGIIISVLYRVPGAFATITTFLAMLFSIIAYRNLNLTFSFDTSVALLAGIFISFITIVNFLSYIPRLLKQKNLNLKFGIIKSFKYFVRNSIGIHVTSLIIALVFLYFGQFQIQGFGAMLVINTLMSLLLNVGVFIGFISILSFGLLIYKPNLMFNSHISEYITNIEITGFDNTTNFEQKPWITQLVNSIMFNKIWIWVIASVVGLLSILGVVLLSTGLSQNVLISNEYYTILITGDDKLNIINALNSIGINVDNGNSVNVVGSLLNNAEISNLLNNGSIQVIQENNYITTMVVKSLVDTCLIAMGFCLVWSLLWLNIVNIINVFVVQLMSLLTFGLLGIFQLPIDINVIIIISLGFLINNVMIYSNFINLKFNYQMKSSWTFNEIKDYVLRNQKENISLYMIEYLVIIGSLLILMIFVSTDTIVANGYIVLNCLLNMCIIYALIPYLFMGMMTARELYIVKSINHKKQTTVFDYDKIDEQEIIGINKHVYNQI